MRRDIGHVTAQGNLLSIRFNYIIINQSFWCGPFRTSMYDYRY
jgi:hypothetical protein